MVVVVAAPKRRTIRRWRLLLELNHRFKLVNSESVRVRTQFEPQSLHVLITSITPGSVINTCKNRVRGFHKTQHFTFALLTVRPLTLRSLFRASMPAWMVPTIVDFFSSALSTAPKLIFAEIALGFLAANDSRSLGQISEKWKHLFLSCGDCWWVSICPQLLPKRQKLQIELLTTKA